MRFASIGSANAASYAGAGAQVANSAARIFDVQRKTGPDYAGLSKVAMATQSAEKQTAMKTAAYVTKEGINQLKNKTILQHKAAVFNDKLDRANRQRKAGAIAAVGKIAGAAVLSRDNTKGREYPTSNFDKIYSEYKTKKDATNKKYDADIDALGDAPSVNSISSAPATGVSAGKVTTGVDSSQGTSNLGSALTGNAKTVSDAIAKFESGKWGYEAFNQGGAAGGTRAVGTIVSSDTLVLWYHGIMIPGPMVTPCYCGTMVSWYQGRWYHCII